MTTATALSSLQKIEIADACERLCLDYAHFADAGRMDEWAQLFAEDAELHLFGQVHKGPAAIRESVGAGSAAASTTVHCTTNIRVEVESEDRASGTAYIIVYVAAKGAAPAGSVPPLMVGRYVDSYRRTAGGWRFARRAFEPLIQ